MVAVPEREQPIYVEIDWLDDGTFSHPNSNLSNTLDGVSRLLPSTLTVQRGRDSARPLGMPMVASAAVQVHNADKLLSPEFAGSPIYQLVEPGRAYRIRMSAGAAIGYNDAVPYNDFVLYNGSAILPVVSGFLEEPSYTSGFGTHATTLSCLGSLSSLRRGVSISTPLYQNIRTDDAVNRVLDAVGWHVSKRRLDFGNTTLDLWWLDSADPFTAMLEILGAEGPPSAVYETADGTLVFESRLYRSTAPRSTTPRFTFSDKLGTSVGYNDPIAYNAHIDYNAGSQVTHAVLSYAPSYGDVRNAATYDIVRRASGPLGKVWEYGGPLNLGANEVRTLRVTLSEPCTGAVVPTDGASGGLDYVIASGALTGPPTLTNVNAQRLDLTFHATAAGALINGVTSNGPQLRAVAWQTVSSETVANAIDASDSIARTKGPRSLSINGRREINAAYAQAVCDAAVTYYQVNRPIVTMPVENVNGTHLLVQLTTEVSDRITILSEQLGMGNGAEFWVEQINHQRGPAKLVSTYVCERTTPITGAGLWDDTTIGTGWDVSRWGQ